MIGRILTAETRGGADKALTPGLAKLRVVFLFLLLVVGILANWFWVVGWNYLADPSNGLQLGLPLAIVVRSVLSFIVAGLTFIVVYNRVNLNTSESWIPYFLAFQNGFFWQAAFAAVGKQFQA